MPDVQSFIPAIKRILTSPNVDLSTISAKRVRKQLVTDGESEAFVRHHKVELDAIIAQVYEAVSSGGSAAVDAMTVADIKPAVNGHDAQASSSSAGKRKRSEDPEFQTNFPPSSQPQSLASKKVKQANGTAGRSAISSDAEYARQLSFELNARSTRAGHPTSNGNKAKFPTKKAKRSKATVSDDEDGDVRDSKPRKKTARGGLGKEFVLSDALAEITGEPVLTRPQTVKKLWEHIKANNLQNPLDKRQIICDSKLKAVFHVDRVNMFTMNKILGEHFLEPGERA